MCQHARQTDATCHVDSSLGALEGATGTHEQELDGAVICEDKGFAMSHKTRFEGPGYVPAYRLQPYYDLMAYAAHWPRWIAGRSRVWLVFCSMRFWSCRTARLNIRMRSGGVDRLCRRTHACSPAGHAVAVLTPRAPLTTSLGYLNPLASVEHGSGPSADRTRISLQLTASSACTTG